MEGAVSASRRGFYVLAADTRADGHGESAPAHRAQTVKVQTDRGREGQPFCAARHHDHVGEVVTWTNVSGAHNVVLAGTSSRLGTPDRPCRQDGRDNGPANRYPVRGAHATTPSSSAGQVWPSTQMSAVAVAAGRYR